MLTGEGRACRRDPPGARVHRWRCETRERTDPYSRPRASAFPRGGNGDRPCPERSRGYGCPGARNAAPMIAALDRMLLGELSAFIAARMGLHFPEERWPDMARGLTTACT